MKRDRRVKTGVPSAGSGWIWILTLAGGCVMGGTDVEDNAGPKPAGGEDQGLEPYTTVPSGTIPSLGMTTMPSRMK